MLPRLQERTTKRSTARFRRLPSAILVVPVALVPAALALLGAAGWHYSDLLLEPPGVVRPAFDVQVVGVRARAITLEATEGALRRGRWGLRWTGGYGRLGAIRRLTSGSVTRRFRLLLGDPPHPGQSAAIDPDAFPPDPHKAFGYRYRTVRVHGELGPMPAWFVPGSRSTWAVFVHGRGGTRSDDLRALPPFVDAGLPSLVITYRNDPGAPASPDHLDHFGYTEWRDVASAASFAFSHGARRVVLIAYSYGAEMALRYLELSQDARRVAGVVLDSPVVDWGPVFDRGAARRNVPGLFVAPTMLAARVRTGIDWGALNQLRQTDRIHVPILLLQGTADAEVPLSDAERFSDLLPGLVDYVTFPGAGHVEAWNRAPARYTKVLDGWLRMVLRGI